MVPRAEQPAKNAFKVITQAEARRGDDAAMQVDQSPLLVLAVGDALQRAIRDAHAAAAIRCADVCAVAPDVARRLSADTELRQFIMKVSPRVELRFDDCFAFFVAVASLPVVFKRFESL